MWTRFGRAIAAGIDLFLPPACLLCGQLLPPQTEPQSLCTSCQKGMPASGKARCSRCAQSFTFASSSHLCGSCLQHPPCFTVVHAACAYQEQTKLAIHSLKYRNQITLARPLGRLLAKAFSESNGNIKFTPDLVVPVPLHASRMRTRGFNQALEIARPLARQLQAPLDAMLLQRIRKTPQQQGLSAIERRKNLREAFALSSRATALKILLVDDVMTTGETVRECSRILQQGGASEVQVAVIGRA